jgi:ABC-2 type transport system permease protein
VDRILISLKFTLLRNSSKGLRVAGWIIGALLVAGTWLAAALATNAEVRSSVLSLAFVGWVTGAALGPILLSGNGVLRPDYFALLPIDKRALSRGLLLTTFVSIASAMVLAAFFAAAIHAVLLSPVTLGVVVVGAPLTWIFAITTSRLIYGLLGAAMRSKVGVEIAGIQFGLMFAVMFTGWMVVQAAVESIPALIQRGLPAGPITVALEAFPSSWPLLAIEEAATGRWGTAVFLLGALALLDAVLVLAAIAVLTPREDVPARRRAGRRLSATLVDGDGILPKTQLGAVIGKEYRQWTRDPWRALEVRSGVWTGIAIGFFALVGGGYSVLAAFSGLIVAFMMSIAALNLFGQDGTAVWQTVVGQDESSTRSDVRGRQWAVVLVFLPQSLLISALFLVLTQHWWVAPAVLAALPALFGAGSGAALLTSAAGVSPGVDPRRRVGPNDANGNVGLHVWATMILTLVGIAPTTFVVVLSLVQPSWMLFSAAVVVGFANGWLAAWLYGRIAIAYLSDRMPDVYTRVRYGRVFRPASPGILGWMEKTTLRGEEVMIARRQKERQDKMAATHGS